MCLQGYDYPVVFAILICFSSQIANVLYLDFAASRWCGHNLWSRYWCHDFLGNSNLPLKRVARACNLRNSSGFDNSGLNFEIRSSWYRPDVVSYLSPSGHLRRQEGVDLCQIVRNHRRQPTYTSEMRFRAAGKRIRWS